MITTPFRWPGAKNKLLFSIFKFLKPLLDKSDKFCEPFVGGAAVALEVARLYPKTQIILNDKDYGLFCFWKLVAEDDDANLHRLINKLNITPTINLFYNTKNLNTEDPVLSAFRTLFLNRTTFSGIISSGPIGGKEQNSKYKVNCRYNFNKLQKKIINCHNLLKGRTKVVCKDFQDLDTINDNSYVLYIDPPYVKAGSMLYDNSMNLQEHNALANILLERNNWVLSYDDDQLIRRLYQHCDIHNTKTAYSIDGVKNKWKNKNELIIVPKS